MKIVIDKESISIVFKDIEEKEKFIESKKFKKLLNWVSNQKEDEPFDWEKWKKEHPEFWNPITYPIPNQIQDPPIDISPRIDDPVRFPSTTEPYRQSWITVTQDTEQHGGCDATPKFNGCDATPRYGKATVDWPSKYPCEVDSEFLNKKKQFKRK